MRGRGPPLSTERKPVFKDTKSALITIAVIIVLVAFALFAIDHNNVTRLTRTQEKAAGYQEAAFALIEARVDLAATMAQILGEEGQAEDLLHPIVRKWKRVEDVQAASSIYLELDEALAQVQKHLYGQDIYLRLAPYFEEIYDIERALTAQVEEYNSQADLYNAIRSSFPATLAARRLGMGALARFSIASALKGRP